MLEADQSHDGNRPAGPAVATARSPHTRMSVLAAGLAVLGLVAWTMHWPLLATFLPGRPALSPMTATLLLLSAIGAQMLPTRHRAASALGATVVSCGVLILVAHALGVPARSGWQPGSWSSAITGLAFLASGTASVLLGLRRMASGQVVAFGVLLFAVLLGLGHVFPGADLYRYLPGTGVAIPTVIGFAAVSLSQLLACRHGGWMGALGSRSTAGRTGRRLLWIGSVAVVGIALAAIGVHEARLLDAPSAVLVVAWGAIVVLVVTLWGLAVAVDRAELARRTAEQERDEMRQMVAASVTHDLRSPLQASTMVGALLERLVTEPRAADLVQRLQRSNRRLDRLLRSLLDTLALGSGRTPHLHASPVVLQELVAEVVAENDGVLAGRVQCEGEATGWWDRDAFFRVIENLLLNAVKYGTAGSTIRVRIRAEARGQVALTVANDGVPIEPGDREAIFQPFARGSRARTGEQAGWGVGLAFARSVAESHGGTVRVAASDAQQTVFEFRVPLDGRVWLAR